jgi:hypothetical protein
LVVVSDDGLTRQTAPPLAQPLTAISKWSIAEADLSDLAREVAAGPVIR